MSKKTPKHETSDPSTAKKSGADLTEEDLEKVEGAWGTILTDLGVNAPKKKINPTDQSGH